MDNQKNVQRETHLLKNVAVKQKIEQRYSKKKNEKKIKT